MSRIAFLGLGEMGSRMAAHLIAAGHDVTVWNRSPGPRAGLEAKGATWADTPRAAVAGAEFAFSMVTNDEAAEAVWLDPAAGAAGGMAAGSVAVESSTVTPDWVRQWGGEMAGRSVAALDAQVVGTRPQADAAQLVFLVGGEADAVGRARPVLGAMGSAVHHVGPAGTGATMKLAVNALYAVQVAAVAELAGFLAAGRIPFDRATEVLTALPTTSPAAAGALKLMAAGRYDPLFPVALVEKDLGYAVRAADGLRAELPVTAAARAVFGRAAAAGLAGENIVAVAKLYPGG